MKRWFGRRPHGRPVPRKQANGRTVGHALPADNHHVVAQPPGNPAAHLPHLALMSHHMGRWT